MIKMVFLVFTTFVLLLPFFAFSDDHDEVSEALQILSTGKRSPQTQPNPQKKATKDGWDCTYSTSTVTVVSLSNCKNCNNEICSGIAECEKEGFRPVTTQVFCPTINGSCPSASECADAPEPKLTRVNAIKKPLPKPPTETNKTQEKPSIPGAR